MNVKELIEKLSNLPQDALVLVPSHKSRDEFTLADDEIEHVQYIPYPNHRGDVITKEDADEDELDYEPNAVTIVPTDG